MSVIDTHCHLDIARNQGINTEKALKTAHNSGVSKIVQIATGLNSSRSNHKLVDEQNQNSISPELYWTAGLHPQNSKEIEDLPEIIKIIKKYRNHKYFLGIGETGLDYYRSNNKHHEQKESFIQHLALAAELRLPVILHLRDGENYEKNSSNAFREALEILREYPDVRGVLHCFTYGYNEAKLFVDMGWFIGFSGILTFKNAKAVQESAQKLPLNSLLVETDAPFLAPVPYRGKTNEPAYVVHTINFLAELRKEKPDTTKNQIFDNSENFVSWKNKL